MDTWSEIQEVKTKKSLLREKLAQRKLQRAKILASTDISSPATTENDCDSSTAAGSNSSAVIKTEIGNKLSSANVADRLPSTASRLPSQDGNSTTNSCCEVVQGSTFSRTESNMKFANVVEKCFEEYVSDVELCLPVSFTDILKSLEKKLKLKIFDDLLKDILEKFSAQKLIRLERKQDSLEIASIDHKKINALFGENEPNNFKRKITDDASEVRSAKFMKQNALPTSDLESLLLSHSACERETKKMSEEIQQLLSAPSTKEQSLVEKFQSQGGTSVKEFCQNGTKEDCRKLTGDKKLCTKVHFRKIIHKHTEEVLGDCSFLNTCFHVDTCKYVHYKIDYPEETGQKERKQVAIPSAASHESTTLFPPQWVCCDLRKFDLGVLGKFTVVMADPPWDIHMELPYGTMSDDEMRGLPVPAISDDGYIFLWVTGRAMELGRECLKLWGYERVDEIIWVKTNQLQRLIRTGRTGHWLNHGKEHCLVGVKGAPDGVNRCLDCDVIVAEVRATSHKPDEIYGIIERLAPGARKIELFGRPHNIQPNWITIGNQLDGIKLLEPDVVRRFKRRYPDGVIGNKDEKPPQPPQPPPS